MTQKDAEYERLLAEERLILDATEMVASLMADTGISRAELAKRINKTRGFVTQVLAGDRNMTLRTLAAICYALGARVQVSAQTSAASHAQIPHRHVPVPAAVASPTPSLVPGDVFHFWTAPDTYLPTLTGTTFMIGPTTYLGAGVPSGNVSRITTFRLDLPLIIGSALLGGQATTQILANQPKPPRRIETRVPTAA